jgi:hypothetical protein
MARGMDEMRLQVERGELSEDQFSLAASAFNIDHAYGTYETAIDYVHMLQDAGVDEVMCIIQMGTVPQDVCMETLRQWGEHVIPHFRGGGPEGSDGRTPSIAGTPS